jgi:L-ascorbate metabolism protein UlaG (beta-lactamase superfamily)
MAALSLREKLNESVKIVNKSRSNEILALKYNRFVATRRNGYTLLENGKRRVWGQHIETVKKNSDRLTQPIYEQGKWYHMEHQANHSLEAAAIFLETQLRRLSRLLSFGKYCKYFSQEESGDEIYELHAPTLSTEVPTVHNIGHATLLFQMGEMNILTDPAFGDLNPLFYPRQTRPGLEIADLPPIDVILISHNHRDHCDLDSLKQLVPHQPQVLVPKGDFKLFKDLGFSNVHEHEWWTTTTISCNGELVDFHSVPARHWSGRGVSDTQTSLMCSWVFKRQDDAGAIYFRGDTAVIEEEMMEQIKNFVRAPIMANFQPGGPNHSRRWMESTHQSVLDSMMSCFEVTNEPPKCMTFLMHHNAYELGTDRFNEAILIQEQIFQFLNGELSLTDLPEFVQKQWGNGLPQIIQDVGADNFIRFLRDHFHSPKIGQRIELRLN